MMFPSVFGENLFDDWMDDFGFRDNFFSGKNLFMANMQKIS